MKKVLLIGSIVGFSALILLATTSTFAKGNRYGHGRGFGEFSVYALEQHASEIGLSTEQLDNIKRITNDTKRDEIQLQADMKKFHLDLQEAMDVDKPDKKKIETIIESINQLENKLKKMRIMTFVEAKSILTPEQIEKVKTIVRERRMDRQERRQHNREHRQQMRGDRPGPPDMQE